MPSLKPSNAKPSAASLTDPTRQAGFALLSAVLDRHRPIEEALDHLPPLDPRDRAAAHRLAAAALRRLGSLDAALEPSLRRAPPIPVRHILRLGAAQLLLLNTPAHAAVATSVALARTLGLQPFAGLVNAVLRKIATGGPALLDNLDGPRLDTPAWLWTSWGPLARAIAEAHQLEAPIDLSWQPPRPDLAGAIDLPTGSLRLPAGTRIADLAGYAEGRFWVQDAAAAIPATLLAMQPGETVADLCAAPGGKTAQLAAAGARVIALERNPARIGRLRDNLDRLQLSADIVQADATLWQPDAPLDAVLLDAPCSATGTIRRHPDIPHLKRASDIAPLTRQQDVLLDAACAMLKPGGRLVYAVCSLQPDEGPDRITAALQRLPLRLDPIHIDGLSDTGTLQTHPALWPDRGGLDGFFAAKLIKE
jgi:16S rRNA (cytosine967-C5)-methyltransferase